MLKEDPPTFTMKRACRVDLENHMKTGSGQIEPSIPRLLLGEKAASPTLHPPKLATLAKPVQQKITSSSNS